MVIGPRNSSKPAVVFMTVNEPRIDVYVSTTVTSVLAPAAMVTGCAGARAAVTSTVPGIAPLAVSVTVHEAPAGSGAMTSGSSAAPAGYATDPTATPSHAASSVTGPR